MLCLAPLFQLLIDRYGWRGALQIISAIMANVIVCASLLKSSSLEKSPEDGTPKKRKMDADERQCCNMRDTIASNLSLCHNPRFIFAITNGFWLGMGYTTAVIYVIPYAIDVGITKTKASLLLTIFGISSLVGRLCNGWLIDKHIVLPSQLSTACWLICAVVAFFFPLSKQYIVLATLLVLFGFCSGISNSLLFMIMKNAVGTQKASSAYSWLLLCNGFGALTGILLSGEFSLTFESPEEAIFK